MSPRTANQPPPKVLAYVDGACHPNPGRGGWGVLLRRGPHEKRLSGLVPDDPTTNQRAEVFATMQALTALKAPCRVHVISDSQYLVQTMLGNYRRRANLDHWERLDAAAEPHEVEWTWVRGHAGDAGNEIANARAERETAA